MDSKNLILVGGGGHCKSVIDVAESAGYKIKGIIDNSENLGKEILGYSVIGTDESIKSYIQDAYFIVSVGQIKDSILRVKLQQKIKDAGGILATIIASTAYISKYAYVGEGTVILHHAVVNAGVRIGRGCIINTCANIEHDTEIGDFCHISTGAMVNGNCKVGSATFIGSQSVIFNGIEVTPGCIIGAGSLIQKNLTQKGIYYGNPAVLKRLL